MLFLAVLYLNGKIGWKSCTPIDIEIGVNVFVDGQALTGC
jgi:hypothetical protein